MELKERYNAIELIKGYNANIIMAFGQGGPSFIRRRRQNSVQFLALTYLWVLCFNHKMVQVHH